MFPHIRQMMHSHDEVLVTSTTKCLRPPPLRDPLGRDRPPLAPTWVRHTPPHLCAIVMYPTYRLKNNKGTRKALVDRQIFGEGLVIRRLPSRSQRALPDMRKLAAPSLLPLPASIPVSLGPGDRAWVMPLHSFDFQSPSPRMHPPLLLVTAQPLVLDSHASHYSVRVPQAL